MSEEIVSETEIDKNVYPDPHIRGLSLLDSDSEHESISDYEVDREEGQSEYGSDSSLHISDSISVHLEDYDPEDPEFLAFLARFDVIWSDYSDDDLDLPPSPAVPESDTESLASRFTIDSEEESA